MAAIPSSPAPNRLAFWLVGNTQILESPFNKSIQGVELPGARWAASLSWGPKLSADLVALEAFIQSLRGRSVPFTMGHARYPTPTGTISGSPTVNGASQTGTTLNVNNLALSTNGLLLPGDFFSVNSELKRVTASLDSNGAGEGVLTFTPPLRAAPSDAAAITYTNPTTSWRLASDQDGRPQYGHLTTALSITALEDF